MRRFGYPIGILTVMVVIALGISTGPSAIPPVGAIRELLSRIPLLDIGSTLPPLQGTVVWDIRFPRVILALMVGAMLSVSGAAYQGVFRNPLADPYLLGTAAGAGLGATIAIGAGIHHTSSVLSWLPVCAFAGSLLAVLLTYLIGGTRQLRSTATLVLAGVAVTSLLTALQTFLQQRQTDNIREIYSWILGRLSAASWNDVALMLPYAVVATVALMLHRRLLDVMRLGDEEATSVGLNVRRTRLVIVLAASVGTAAAVSVSGLIGFVGVIVPHLVRLIFGVSYRVIVPLSILFGGSFLVLADVVARTLLAPEEIPIGVITATLGAPFFLLVMRLRRGVGAT